MLVIIPRLVLDSFGAETQIRKESLDPQPPGFSKGRFRSPLREGFLQGLLYGLVYGIQDIPMFASLETPAQTNRNERMACAHLPGLPEHLHGRRR